VQTQKQAVLGFAEDIREVWAPLYGVLNELCQECTVSSRGQHSSSEEISEMSSTDDGRRSCHNDNTDVSERLAAVCEVVLDWGRSLVGTNLEGLQYILARVQAASKKWSPLAVPLQELVTSLQAEVRAKYGGRLHLPESELQELCSNTRTWQHQVKSLS
jgi:hypothetical protein